MAIRIVGRALPPAGSTGGNQEWLPYKIGCSARSDRIKLTRGLREFWWKKPKQFAGSAPAIYLQQRYAGLRKLDFSTGELLDHFGKIWLVTNYHDAVGVGLAKQAAQSCDIESVGQGGLGF